MENGSGPPVPPPPSAPLYRDTEASQGSSLLQVGLSIQTGGLHVAHTPGVGGVEEQEVRRDNLVAGHLDKISHSHVLPVLPHKLLGPPDIRHTGHDRIYSCFLCERAFVRLAMDF